MKRLSDDSRWSMAKTLMIILLLWSFSGCTHRITIQVPEPPKAQTGGQTIDLSKYHTVAVADFDGPSGFDISRYLEQELIQFRYADSKPHFTLVTRDQLQKVMKEFGIQSLGTTDQNTVKKMGKVLNTDAIITGNVTHYSGEELLVPDTKLVTTNTGMCHQRRAYVAFNVAFIGTEDGQIKVAESPDSELIAKQCPGGHIQLPGEPAPEPFQSLAQMQKKAAIKGAKQFVAMVSPHFVDVEITVRDKSDGPTNLSSAEENAVNRQMKSGWEFARAKNWQRALGPWSDVVKKKPECPACLFNLGVAAEMTADLERAKELYERAAALQPLETDYVQAVSRIENRLKLKSGTRL